MHMLLRHSSLASHPSASAPSTTVAMRGSWRDAAAMPSALLLLLLLASFSTPSAALDQREVLMNVGAKPPALLGEATINLLHDLPRWDGAPHRLGRVDPSNDDDLDEVIKYALGVVLPVAISFFLALLTWASCGGFCGARRCCNKCGRRTATRAYTPRDQLWLKIAIVFLGAVSVTLFVLGLISNAAFSASLDEAYVKSDALVEHLYQFHAPLKTMSLSTSDALLQVRTLNSSVLAQLPADVGVYQACATLMFTTMQMEQRLLEQMAPITGNTNRTAGGAAAATTTDDSAARMDLAALAADLRSMNSHLAQMPDLNAERASLQAYKSSLDTHLPSPLWEQAVMPATRMTDTQTRFAVASTAGVRLSTGLQPAMTSAGAAIPAVLDGLTQYDLSSSTSPASSVFTLRSNLLDGDTSSDTVSRVNNLHTAMAQLPDRATFTSNLATFQTHLATLQAQTIATLELVGAMSDDIAAFDNGTPYGNLLTSLRSGVPLVAHDPALASNLNRTGSDVSLLGSRVVSLGRALNASIVGVESLRAGTNESESAEGGLGANMLAINASLPQLQCIRPVFSQLLALNKSVLILPPRADALLARRSQMLVQLQRLLRIQHDLTKAHNGLRNLSTALDSFPDLDEVGAGAQALRDAIDSFPDCALAAEEVRVIDASLASLTDTYLGSIQSALPAFSSDVASSRTDVDRVAGALRQLHTDAVDSFPPALLQSWGTFAASMGSLATSMAPSLSSVHQHVNEPSFVGAGPPVTDPLLTSFVQSLDAYINLMQDAPASTTLRSAMQALENEITNTNNAQGSIVASLDRLQSAASALPSTLAAATELTRVHASSTGEPLGPLLTGVPHTVLSSAISNAPDFSAPAGGIDATASALSAQSAPLVLLESNLASSDNFMSSDDLAAVSDGLNAIDNLVSNFPDLSSPIGSLSVAAGGLASAESNIASYRHEYYVARQSTVMFKNRIDWLRLLGFMLVLFVPFCVAACGAYSWLRSSPKPSLYMGMCSFSIVAIFFVMAAVQLGPAIVVADQCKDLDGFLRTNLASVGLSANVASPWVNLTAGTDAGVLFDYFSTCTGEKPELLTVFNDPHKVLRDNNINFADYQTRVRSSLSTSGDVVQLRPAVWTMFDRLNADVDSVVLASQSASQLFDDCARSSGTWVPLRESLCSSQGVSGSIALSTCICFLFAICMIPGVCVGITGYKRFDPTNFGVTHMLEKQDPYAAGLAERPVHSPSGVNGGSGGGAGGGGGPGGLASPSQAIDVSSIELQERHVRRATLQMALASEPEWTDPEVVAPSPSALTASTGPMSPSRAIYSPSHGAAYAQHQQQQNVYAPSPSHQQVAYAPSPSNQQAVYAPSPSHQQAVYAPQPQHKAVANAPQQPAPEQTTTDPEVVAASSAAAPSPSGVVRSPTPTAPPEAIVYEFE